MLRRLIALSCLLLAVSAVPARAAEEQGPQPELPSWAIQKEEKRPAVLTTLYASYGAIQVMDVVTTRKAIANGAREQNPLMGSGGTGRLIAVKAVAGVSTMFFAERLWKKNKVGAIVVMAALNGASAAIVARNQRRR
jgi:hypothetical protein